MRSDCLRPARCFVLSACLMISGCDNSFTPKSEFAPRLVVLCVLDPSSDTQVARLARSYDADLGSPPVPLTPREVATALVKISDNIRTYTFHDTIVDFKDGTRGRVWISHEFRPQPDKKYTLDVTVEGFTPAHVTAQAPGRLFPTIHYYGVSDTGSALTVLPGTSHTANAPYGYYYRLWVVVKPLHGGVERRMEAPLNIEFSTDTWRYPSPSRDREAKFVKSYIRETHNRLIGNDTFVYSKQLLVQAYALDQPFYSWFKMVQGFEDPVSLRVDRPNISFIDGGLGVFGVVIPDSARFNYHTYMK